jgi:hypothetical protein
MIGGGRSDAYWFNTPGRDEPVVIVMTIDRKDTGQMGSGIGGEIWRARDGALVGKLAAVRDDPNRTMAFAAITSRERSPDSHMIKLHNYTGAAVNYTVQTLRTPITGTPVSLGAPDVPTGTFMAGYLTASRNEHGLLEPGNANFLLQYPESFKKMYVTIVYTPSPQALDIAEADVPGVSGNRNLSSYLWASRKLIACNQTIWRNGAPTTFAGSPDAGRSNTIGCHGPVAVERILPYGQGTQAVGINDIRIMHYDGGATSMRNNDGFRIGLQLSDWSSSPSNRVAYVAYHEVV